MKGYFRTDSDTHWYFVPENLIESFEQSKRRFSDAEEYSNEWYEHIDKFVTDFDQYRLSGGIQHLLVDIDEKYL
jgi:hypothetical protein